MRGFLLLMAAALCTSAAALAQFTVTCTVTDTTGTGEPFATARIYRQADTTRVVTTGVTDIDGHFTQPLQQAGDYVLKISAVGKVTLERPFAVSQQARQASLGTLVMHVAGNVLQGVTVTAQAPLVTNEMDRLSYNMQSDDESKTKTTFDMLRKVPLVAVDGQDNITVRGSSNFKIYRNGHPDPSLSQNPKEVLKAIPASMIKKIEVITEPGAKYDAEGVAAILNIVTVDNSRIKGVTGTVYAGVNNYGTAGGGGYITTQVGKLITNLNYGTQIQNRREQKQHSTDDTRYLESGSRLHRESAGDAAPRVHYGNLQASLEPDTLNLFTLSVGGFYYDYRARGNGLVSMTDSLGQPIYGYRASTRNPKCSYYNLDGRFDYQHKTSRKDETLTLSYMLNASRNHAREQYELSELVNAPFAYTGYANNNRENFWEHTFQFDWTRPFARYHKFETGVKYIYRQNKSHSLMDYDGADDLDTDTRFNHLTQVAAAYASYTYSRDKWSARAGLRYEFSYLRAKYPDGNQPNYHRSLNDWVPSAMVNYQLNPANSLKLAFATRINRPGISFLNPAVNEGPYQVSYGNSHLSSARSYSATLTFMHIGQKFTFNVQPDWQYSNNGICDVRFVRDGKTVTTYANQARSSQVGASAYVQWSPFSTTSLMLNASGAYNDVRNSSLGLKGHGFSGNLWVNLSQQLPWRLRFSGGGGLYKQAPSLYGHDCGSGYYYLSLQRSFLKEDRLTVSFNTSQPFSGRYHQYKSYIDRGDYTSVGNYHHTARRFSLNVSFRFGSLKASVKKTNTTIENNDVVGGSNSNSGGGQQQGGGGQQGR